MTAVRNRNHQVTRRDYAECVAQQVAFLHSQESTDPRGYEESDLLDATTVYYDNSVSVDAAAADLFYQGW